VAATRTLAEHEPELREEDLSIEELARRQGVRPVTSVDEPAEPEAFETGTELDEFLADLYAFRRANIG